MKNMASAAEFFQAPPPGRYPAICTAAIWQDDETGARMVSKNGAEMIRLTWEVADGPGKGAQSDDYIITDGLAKGGGIGKRKLRGLGFNVDTDAELNDAQICQSLLGRQGLVLFGNEQRMKKDEAGNLHPDVALDPKTNQTIKLMRLVVEGYVPAVAAGVSPGVPAGATALPQFSAPQFAQPALGGQLPTPGLPGLPVAPPFAPQLAQQPLALAPQGAQAAPPIAAPPGWGWNGAQWVQVTPNGAAPTGGEAVSGKKGRKLPIQDVTT